ncbi:MAG: EAL domain-containing protein [Rhodocyclales bacterium GT-UBC]|nr:MAG: EAL domain-containing protein [Rhodocyclales bacterium GT-UBC]
MIAGLDEFGSKLLREADILLPGLFNYAKTGVYVIQDNRFVFVNRYLADLFGYTQQELCAGFGPVDLTHPPQQAMAQREIDRRLSGEIKASFYACRGVCKDGHLIDVEVYGVTTQFEGRPAIIGILLDVTERCAAEREIADQLGFIRQLMDTIPSPLFFKDEAGRYLGCNTAFENYIGIARADLIGRSVFDIAPPDLADKYHAADRELFDYPGTQTYEAAVTYADGTRRDVVFNKATFTKADGSLGGLVGVILDISERKQMERAIWHEANYDALTGLANRRRFKVRLNEEIAGAEQASQNLALLFIDLDRFKEVNDTLGHDIGDLLLIEAGRRICRTLGNNEHIARLGGDEFVAILPTPDDRESAPMAAQQLIRALDSPFELNGHLVYVSASIGIAYYPDDTRSGETLLSYADQAMYAAKSMGRNCFQRFTPSLQQRARQRLALSNDLRRALGEGQFEVYYQPIVELGSRRIVKAEALIRWHHPQRGMVSPAEFIPIAEDIGVIGEIGQHVFEQATTMALRWNTPGMGQPSPEESLQISINISPRQFVTGKCGDWIAYLRERGLPSAMLSAEITEGLLLDERPAVVDTLLAFRDAGIQVSIDDFGTGYSAMSYLKKFDIDYLKIDRSFVRDLTTDPGDLAIAEAMIVMAHKLGIRVIAEGVETEAQCALLLEAGCDYAQGFLFSPPVPAASFERLLDQNRVTRA